VTATDFLQLGVSGVLALVLAYGMGKLWGAYLAKDRELSTCRETYIANYSAMLARMEVMVGGFRQALESRWAQEDRDAARR
jgi:hypothetical protein